MSQFGGVPPITQAPHNYSVQYILDQTQKEVELVLYQLLYMIRTQGQRDKKLLLLR